MAATEAEVQAVMEKYDRESVTRHHKKWAKWLVFAVCIIFCLVQLYSAFTGRVAATQLRPLHLGFVMSLVYLIYPVTKKSPRDKLPIYDLILAALAMGVCLYIALQHVELAKRINRNTDLDIYVGALLIILLFECCRRVVGLPIMVVAVVFMLYAYFGQYMPGDLMHRGFSVRRIITQLVYTTEGIMGTPLGASSTFIFLFVLFGAFLERTEVGNFFIDFANAIAGHKRGGPAKVAVLASALEGTVSGSSVANTVGSGSFTIPMMKRLGYRKEFAAAVEATASTGGQIMPPVMGAAAFLMAESVGVPYMEVVKAALIPAALYFVGIYIIIELEARKYGLVGMDKATLPKFLPLVKKKGYLILPLIVIIVFLSIGYTPIFSALVGIASCVLCDIIRHVIIGVVGAMEARKERKEKISAARIAGDVAVHTAEDVIFSMDKGARNVLGVAVACGMAGIIVGMITLTGIGLTLGNSLTALAGGNQYLTLLFTMLASIILGMGVPTTANYLITSTIMAGTVMKVVGCDMLAAHMFVFYFGIIADITPPVALAAMAGAAIAKSDPFRTGLNAVKLAIAAFIVPYIFVFNNKMLFIGAQWYDILQIGVTSIIGMIGVAAALEGYMTRHAHLLQRILFLAGGLLLIEPGLMTDIVGIVIIAVAFLWQALENKRLGGKMVPSVGYYKDMSAGKRIGFVLAESFVMLGRLVKGKEKKA
ncbi:MAG: TRAP transporter permease [Clostridiales bacterium]|nr:TRAP transporter permease [Clostridiales bacterium]